MPTDIKWQRDPSLERKLISDYIARSHKFRLGYDSSLPFRTSAITALNSGLISPGSFNSLLRRLPTLHYVDLDRQCDTPRLHQLAQATGGAARDRRALRAVNSQFGAVTHPLELELASGGLDFATGSHVWRWVGSQQGTQWVLGRPSPGSASTPISISIGRCGKPARSTQPARCSTFTMAAK